MIRLVLYRNGFLLLAHRSIQSERVLLLLHKLFFVTNLTKGAVAMSAFTIRVWPFCIFTPTFTASSAYFSMVV